MTSGIELMELAREGLGWAEAVEQKLSHLLGLIVMAQSEKGLHQEALIEGIYCVANESAQLQSDCVKALASIVEERHETSA